MSDVDERSTVDPSRSPIPRRRRRWRPTRCRPARPSGMRTPSGLRLDIRLAILIGVLVALCVVGYITAAGHVPVREQHLHDAAARGGDRRGQRRHDVRDHLRRHRPVRRLDGRARQRVDDDARDAVLRPVGDGALRARGRARRRADQRGADRVRPGGAVHRDARHVRVGPRAGRAAVRAAHAGRHRAGLPRLLPRRPARHPGADLDARRGVRDRLGGAQPHHVRPPHVRGRRQRRGRAPGRHQRQAAHRATCTRSPACAAGSPR